MGKPNNIRKKALDLAKKGQWEKALEEFTRLVEVEQHNPNLFNEIGDIHLKLGNKREAFKRYQEAIDAYAKVGLHNNAVAVCKKILRLNPHDTLVYGKMAALRQRQGFGQEAVAFSVTFFDKIADAPDAPGDDISSVVLELTQVLDGAPEVLKRAIEFFLKRDRNQDAAPLMVKLEQLYAARGTSAERQRLREKMGSIGLAPAAEPAPPPPPEKLETVESVRNHAQEDPARKDVPFTGTIPSHIRRSREGDAATDFGVIDVSRSRQAQPETEPLPPPVAGTSDGRRPGLRRATDHFEVDPSAIDKERLSGPRPDVPSPLVVEPSRVVESEIESEAESDVESRAESDVESEEGEEPSQKEYVIPDEYLATGANGDLDAVLAGVKDERSELVRAPDVVGRSAADVKADVDEEDHRSRYDLGMAYLEMGLFAEAVREFQFAASSPPFRVRSLEMIGRCYINQNQPLPAIKHLVKALALVHHDDHASLGIKYNLAAAYEMAGEFDKAKALFEQVCAVDITFRDVRDRIRKYAS